MVAVRGSRVVIEWLILIVLVGVFAVVLFALRLGDIQGDEWDVMSARQRRELMRERHEANPALRSRS